MPDNKILLPIILVLYLLLAIAYGVINPLFEAPDEHWHYFTAQSISETGQLPSVDDEPDPWTAQEAAQPPLYYLLASRLIKPIDTNDAREKIWPNSRVMLGDASSPTNRNAFVHPPEEAFPWTGYVLAAHLVRLFSALVGLGTLLVIYRATTLVWPLKPERSIIATSLVAFLPQYLFIHSSITNDVLIIFLSTATIWQLLRMWSMDVSWKRVVLLAITIGLAVLTKMAGLLLLVYSLFFLAVVVLREMNYEDKAAVFKKWFRYASVVIFIAVLISGWMLWRNWQLYGDVTATSQILRFFGGDRQYSLAEVLSETSGLWASIFAVFGWFNVIPPRWIYLVWNGLVLLAVIGFISEGWQRIRARQSNKPVATGNGASPGKLSKLLDWPGLLGFLLAIWVLIVYTGLIRFMLQIHAGQGRLLMPAILPFAFGLVYGVSRFGRPPLTYIAPLLAFATSVYSLFFVISPAYSKPPLLSGDLLPSDASRLEVRLNDSLELLASRIETDEILPGEQVWLTLYWQREKPFDQEDLKQTPMLVVDLLGRGDAVVGKYQSYHGGGLFPASLWPPGKIIVDRFALEVSEKAVTPVQARINVKLEGEQQSVDAGTVKVSPRVWPELSDKVLAQLDGIQLVSASMNTTTVMPGDAVSVFLEWQVINQPGRALTTFVHMGDPSQPPLAQGDGVPLNGHYPTTVWSSGERFRDAYELAIPADLAPGRYPVSIGLYDPVSGLRVPLAVDEERQPNDAYRLGILTITR